MALQRRRMIFTVHQLAALTMALDHDQDRLPEITETTCVKTTIRIVKNVGTTSVDLSHRKPEDLRALGSRNCQHGLMLTGHLCVCEAGLAKKMLRRLL